MLRCGSELGLGATRGAAEEDALVALHAVASRVLRDILKRCVERGATVFLTSHVLEIVERLCTDVGIIAKGKLVYQGSMEQVRAGGSLEDAIDLLKTYLLQKNFEGEKVNFQRGVALIIRTPRAGTSGLLQELRQAVWSVNPNLPLAAVKTLETNYDRSLERTTFTLVLLAISSAMASLLLRRAQTYAAGIWKAHARKIHRRTTSPRFT